MNSNSTSTVSYNEDPCPCSGFEGPEKRLELDFRPSSSSSPDGLRVFNASKWQELLNYARCTILHTTKNEHFDAYVLSESSLFVYPFRILLKTCGTTTLLHCVKRMLEYAYECGLGVELVRYSRKNYLFPHEQKHPHTCWEDEVHYLNQIFNRGFSQIIGRNDEQWHLYMADFSDCYYDPKTKPAEIKTLEIMMHKMHPDAAKEFYRKEGMGDRDKHPAMRNILRDTVETDEFNFTPCGYSMNALDEEAYHTVHVTPELHCSYASYETNMKLTSYRKLISNVFGVFRPGTAQLALFTERTNMGSADREQFGKNIFDDFLIPGYTIKYKTARVLDANCEVILLNYALKDSPKSDPIIMVADP